MWVRFVGKTGRGTLFNFGNPTSAESPYGFRLETITKEFSTGYKRMVRLVVRDHTETDGSINELGKLYDNHVGQLNPPWRRRDLNSNTQNFGTNGVPFYEAYPNNEETFNAHAVIPTDDLNEWFFICATYNPNVNEEWLWNQDDDALIETIRHKKQFWLNHIEPGNLDTFVASTLYGAKCKVEVISRSDLLRARGYKGGNGVGSLEVNVEQEQEQEQSGNY